MENTNNFLDITPSQCNTYIYRIVSLCRLFELFECKQNVLVKPCLWEDPFENFILRSERIYGQCWTFQMASDAMWRIYSPGSNAVRIRSTANKLFNSLDQNPSRSSQDGVFIGRVRYLRNDKLTEFSRNIIKESNLESNMILAQTLLVKRPAFRHEREVRLLYIPYDKNQVAKNLFSYCVDPYTLIDQIMIDPRVSKENWVELKQKIRNRTKFQGEIKRSLLYAPPPDFSEEIRKARGIKTG